MVAEENNAAAAASQSGRKARLMKVGRVVSDKMDKTVVVAVDFTVRHPIYKKAMRRTHKFKAHDEYNRCHTGDRVRIEETRPLSKEKRWIVREILHSASQD
jgi:small subunit ribosomal protein S17